MLPTKNDLKEKTRSAVIKMLDGRLADLLDLKLQAKSAHWNVRGPHFKSLHELFDQIAEVVDAFADETAERLTALGGLTEANTQAVGQKTSLPPYPTDITDGMDHVDAVSTALATAAKGVRASIEQAEEAGDAVTADLLTEIAAGLDKQLWFVEAHQQAEELAGRSGGR
jgi:starvation-inducible DNA-binding protein